MERIDFNTNWKFKKMNEENCETVINIPHDAMMFENRLKTNPGGKNIGYFAGGEYQYTKLFFIPDEYNTKTIIFEFEGVYRNAEVFINSKLAAFRPYGYTNFYVDANSFLKYGEENEMNVIVHNQEQPNSRWYTGSGIYRPVTMYLADQEHILLNGVKIRTKNIQPAIIEVEVDTNASGTVHVDILDNSKLVKSHSEQTNGKIKIDIEIPSAKVWDVENPNLYQCFVRFGSDSVTETFGIRSLEWNINEGLLINKKRVILRGACIHHDNGLLGACSYPEAEARKVKILKENGYNAIRSAHNPCSKALLEACDKQGMLMMDEYSDMWFIHKTEFDYANELKNWWHEDLMDMVNKDYNHPCVILYSTGNEVSETAMTRGIHFTKEMTEYMHQLDPHRPVTCGINIFFNYLSSIGLGVYSDKKAKTKNKPVGSEFYNNMAGLFGDKAMKIGATLQGSDRKTKDAFKNMDIAGYNYGILRYKKDLKKYPNRLILGTETFCKDAYEFWELAKKNPRIIGDFVWAGMDYLGEAGIGAWVYEDYAPKDGNCAGWLTAGSGRIDIIGNSSGEAAYTKVAMECTENPVIAVRPVKKKGKHSPSAWKMTDAMESWSWEGCEGRSAVIEVYARAAKVELYLNNILVGKKTSKNNCVFYFRTTYRAGELTAIAYDQDNLEISRTSLKTAGNETILRVVPEEDYVENEGLIYVHLQYTDHEGRVKPGKKDLIQVKVIGGTLLGLGNACPYNPNGYLKDSTETYFGEALAIIKAGNSQVLEVYASDSKNQEKIVVPIIHKKS